MKTVWDVLHRSPSYRVIVFPETLAHSVPGMLTDTNHLPMHLQIELQQSTGTPWCHWSPSMPQHEIMARTTFKIMTTGWERIHALKITQISVWLMLDRLLRWLSVCCFVDWTSLHKYHHRNFRSHGIIAHFSTLFLKFLWQRFVHKIFIRHHIYRRDVWWRSVQELFSVFCLTLRWHPCLTHTSFWECRELFWNLKVFAFKTCTKCIF